jgi:hypothetical protein
MRPRAAGPPPSAEARAAAYAETRRRLVNALPDTPRLFGMRRAALVVGFTSTLAQFGDRKNLTRWVRSHACFARLARISTNMTN